MSRCAVMLPKASPLYQHGSIGYLSGVFRKRRMVNHHHQEHPAQHSPVHSYVNSLWHVFFQLFNLLCFSLFCCELSCSICFFMSSGCKERHSNKQKASYGLPVTASKWILLFLSKEYVQIPKQLQLLPRFLPAPAWIKSPWAFLIQSPVQFILGLFPENIH